MTAKILNGNALASAIRNELKAIVKERRSQHKRIPGLTVLLVGDDAASHIYVRLKQRDCLEIGIRCDVRYLSSNTAVDELKSIVGCLNETAACDGILVQFPLPDHIRAIEVVELIEPRKDVDGITPHNMGMLTLREPAHRSCTAQGIMSLLAQTGLKLLGKHAIVVGASNHVGRPMTLELLLAGCTVTTAHRYTTDTKSLVRAADIVVSATGQPKLIRGDWVKPGAVVIDVGIERQVDGSLVGDVAFDEVKEVAGWLTPVPGGVGPMTRVSILQNLIDSVRRVEP